MPQKSKSPVPIEQIDGMIRTIRGVRVMLDRDLAQIYGVPTKVFNQAVKRNRQRFPEDFMFRLSQEEAKTLQASRSQTVTLKRGQNIKYLPYAFTEYGALMAANILNSPRAVQMSILTNGNRVVSKHLTFHRCERNRIPRGGPPNPGRQLNAAAMTARRAVATGFCRRHAGQYSFCG